MPNLKPREKIRYELVGHKTVDGVEVPMYREAVLPMYRGNNSANDTLSQRSYAIAQFGGSLMNWSRDSIETKLERQHELLHEINGRINHMSAALDRLTAEVAETRSAAQSLITLVQGLAQQIRDNVDDSDALNQLADDLDAEQKDIADAVTANTTTPPINPAP